MAIRLLELRAERGLSQRQMAKNLNISQGTYNNWENSNTEPSIGQLIELAKFFEVSVDYLIGNTDDFGVVSYENLTDDYKNLLTLFSAASPQMRGAVLTVLKESYKGDNR